MKACLRLLLLCALISISACGWHLRGEAASVDVDSMAVNTPDENFKLHIEQALEDDGVLVHSEAPLVLNISSLRWQSRTVAVDAVGREAEREVRLNLGWSLRAPDKQWQSELQNMSTSRRFQVSPDNPAGAADEDQLARDDMQQEMINRIMRALSRLALEQSLEQP